MRGAALAILMVVMAFLVGWFFLGPHALEVVDGPPGRSLVGPG